MKEKLKIILMIFALGLFVIPKQSFSAQTKDSCCTEVATKDCCKKNNHHSQKPCSKDSENNKCNDCTTCSSCHHSLVTFAVSLNENLVEPNPIIQSGAENFKYISPEISDISIKIWQPPKIG